jgi:enhancing lycopene biosynthesis protein 2
MKIGVLLSGCGVYDGAEIHETVLTLLALEEKGLESICIGIDKEQHHVVNHISGNEMNEKRNMLTEASRIARGNIININNLKIQDIDALIIPGGFGSAKNFTNWAFEGPDGSIIKEVKELILHLVHYKKPIIALCVSPVVVSKALEGSGIKANLTIGSNQEESPYDIDSFKNGLEKTGASVAQKTIREIHIDQKNKIISAPCYMMEASILDIRNNIKQAIDAMAEMI